MGFPEYNLHRALQNSAKSQLKLGLRSTSSNAITLKGIEKTKTEKKQQQNSLNNNTSIYKLNGFYFSLNENTKLRNLAIRVFRNYGRHERKLRQSVFVSVKINGTIAKLTVWHNW